jgi:hypothetical protein
MFTELPGLHVGSVGVSVLAVARRMNALGTLDSLQVNAGRSGGAQSGDRTMALVKVYYAKGYDVATDTAKHSRRMGTMAALADANLGPMMETERVVDDKHLDGNGFWTPTAIVDDDESPSAGSQDER